MSGHSESRRMSLRSIPRLLMRIFGDWGKLADERRRENDERLERALDEADRQREEFYRPRD